MGISKYSWLDFGLTSVGLPLFLVDVVLDVLAAEQFYREGAYGCLGLLLLFLVGSSVLVQVYSWLWYGYDNFEMRTEVEKSVSQCSLKLFHFVQLGIYFRHLGVLETAVKTVFLKNAEAGGQAVCLSHDLSMLRIVETFSESTPQLVLMLTIFLQKALKAVGSAMAVAYCVTTYHRSLRSFLTDKNKQTLVSSIVFFLWNLVLISSRLVALALFASVLPCFIFTHFLCSWMIFFFLAWRWLYRATVALVWYFNWFNVVEGKTRYTTTAYHLFILADMAVLSGVWCWKMSTDPPEFEVPLPYAAVTVGCVLLVYILGLVLKVLYYKWFHPNVGKEELKGDGAEAVMVSDEVDSMSRSIEAPPQPEPYNRRMRKLAENFYS
uniref:XK-related protein n=1 Tax=Salarias fasciatus TaxID=181472 RepID=A0A672HH29_SALFA